MGFSRPEILEGGCHFLLQGNLPDPGIEPASPVLQADSLPAESLGKPHLSDYSLSGLLLCYDGSHE